MGMPSTWFKRTRALFNAISAETTSRSAEEQVSYRPEHVRTDPQPHVEIGFAVLSLIRQLEALFLHLQQFIGLQNRQIGEDGLENHRLLLPGGLPGNASSCRFAS